MTVPLLLVAVALVDAVFAGFRAATGRNARIRKRSYYVLSGWRGFVVGGAGLGVVAVLLVTGLVLGGRYDELVRAGERMLVVLMPFAVLVVVSLIAYWVLPMRPSTFVILVGLGPFTLVRPVVVVAAVAWAVVGAQDWLVWVGSVVAAAGVLAVEPLVHRRWYRAPV
ncbi:oxidoreductase [Saccharothrix sp. NPDC042600]|uniref:oxidoreductase n=1 Tax=Saccharothrix TaxID=2071 RepID=UPI0033D23764|nr:hypothetical protein GCM10017745_74090 [Saccharothrix mutabilis subsp. capreolus]